MDRVVEFQEGSAGQLAEIRLGESFRIILRENRTTGFRWKLVAGGEPACRLTGEKFEPGLAPGAQGVHHWNFQAVQVGAAVIRLILERPWVRAAEPAKSFTLRVRVEA